MSGLGRLTGAGALVVLGAGCAVPSVTPDAPSTRLAKIAAEYSARSKARAEQVSERSFREVQREADSAGALLARLDAIPEAGLTHDEVLTREVLRWEAGKSIQDTLLYWYSFDALPALSPMRAIAPVLAAKTISTASDREEYLAVLARAGAAFGAVRDKMEAQAGRGILMPAETIDASVSYLRSLVKPGLGGPFVPPGARLAALPAAERAGFETQLITTIEAAVNPAITTLAGYVDRTARLTAAGGVGPWQYPGGTEAYRQMVKRETTLDISPEEIHRIALAAMDTLEVRMKAVRDSLGFRGTKAEFHEQLRRDPRFYVSVPDSVGRRLMQYAERIEPVLSRAFAGRPKAPYGARRLDPTLEPSMTYGYYTWPLGDDPKGYYFFNGSDLDQRSLLVIGAISFHELIPGHHYQIMLQRENQALPPFRRAVYYAGYGEGWGEYVSSVVAAELGMYRDGYEIYGRYVFDAFFIARLIVDTGMNLYGWPRSRAVAYMKDHTLESDVQIESETLRYSARSPAQALAYRMGRETIVRLRTKAERALGTRFDLRRFHEAVLSPGSLPLFLLERHIDWWIAGERNR